MLEKEEERELRGSKEKYNCLYTEGPNKSCESVRILHSKDQVER